MKYKYKNLIKYDGLWWGINESYIDELSTNHVDGPFCPNCFSSMSINQNEAFEVIEVNGGHRYKRVSNWEGEYICVNCSKTSKTKLTSQEYKGKFLLKYVSDQRSKIPKVSLDEPPAQVNVRDQDDKYFLAAKIGQKDGKRVGVVYFGEKKKDQTNEDYSQIFIDLDDEQIRFDKSNKHPKDLIAKFKVDFGSSSTELKSKKST